MCSSRTGRRQALRPTSSQGTVGRLDDHCSSAWGRRRKRVHSGATAPSSGLLANGHETREPGSGTKSRVPSLNCPWRKWGCQASFQDLGREPTAGHHLLRHATPSRADLESALEDVRRSCSKSGKGHNPGAALFSSNVLRAYRFLKSYGAKKTPSE